jgi:acetylornithine deacetylase
MTPIDPVQLLQTLVSIPSISGQEEQLAKQIWAIATKLGLRTEHPDRNLVITAGQPGGKRLLFNSHLDTVAPVASWKTDPFTPTKTDHAIIGLGANDAKGSIAAMLCALQRCAQTDLPGEIVLALTVDEEIEEVNEGLEILIGKLGKLDAAVIGEPTDLAICRAQKGRVVLEVETIGLARHAAHAHRIDGKNAVVEAAKAIVALQGWTPHEDHPLLGSPTCEVTIISGGEKQNVIPDKCVFCLDIRTVNDTPASHFAKTIETITGGMVHILSDRLKPFETDENADIVAAARMARPNAPVVVSSTMSDAVWTRHLPTVKIGPGKTERSHTAGEHITLDELYEGVAFYEKLIHAYFAMG